MKKFTCTYLKDSGYPDYDTSQTIESSSAEEAAKLYSQNHPSEYPRIDVSWGLVGNLVIENYSQQQSGGSPQGEATEKGIGIELERTPNSVLSDKSRVSSGGYSLVVTQAEPMLHSTFRFLGWLALGLIPVMALVAMAEDNNQYLGVIPNLCYTAVILWGSAQLIKLLHSIAWNTQEARRERRAS